MNREIKFRAWRKNKMQGPFTLEEMLNVAADMGFHLDAPSPVVWLQYTGLKDKNGVEIYEGDIMTHHDFLPDARLIVEFKNGCFAVDGWDCVRTDFSLGVVVGNIHENGWLLNEN